MVDARLSAIGAKPGMKRLDVAQVVSMDTEVQSTEFVQAYQFRKMNLAQMKFLTKHLAKMKFLTKHLLIANQETDTKPKNGDASSVTRTEEIDQDTQRNPDHLTALRKRNPNRVKKVPVESIMEESGANSIVSDGNTTVSSVTSLLGNSQRSAAKVLREKVDGSRKIPVMMEKARGQIATRNPQVSTKNLHAARRV
jgi:hypothetical protein